MRLSAARTPGLRSLYLALALLTPAALALSACSSAAGGSGASAQAPIKIGVIVPTGTNQDNRPDVLVAINAALSAQNKAGGVNGHQLVIDYCNEQANTNQGISCARQMVSDGVTATVNDFFSANEGVQAAAVLQKGNVAQVDVAGVAPAESDTPINYWEYPPVILGYGAKCQAEAALGHTKLFVYAASVVPFFVKIMSAECATVGVKTVGSELLPVASSTPIDFAPYIQDYVSAGADFAMTAETPPVTASLIKAGAVAGANVHWAVNDNSVTPDIVAELGSAANGVLLDAAVPPLTTDSAGIALYKQQIQAYSAATHNAQAQVQKISNNGLLAWIGTEAVVDVLKEMPAGTAPSAANFRQQLSASHNIPVPILGSWTPGVKGPAGYSSVSGFGDYIETIQNGTYVLAQPTPINVQKFAAAANSVGGS